MRQSTTSLGVPQRRRRASSTDNSMGTRSSRSSLAVSAQKLKRSSSTLRAGGVTGSHQKPKVASNAPLYKTPVRTSSSSSRAVLQPLTNSSRQSYSTSKSRLTASPGSNLYASISKISKDPRPLSDKSWQQTQTKKLLEFLRENNYPNTQLTNKSFPLSSTDFRNVFNFLYGHLCPSYVLPQKFEVDIVSLLKALGYPGTISKSNFVTLGSLHSWPAVLGVLVFIKDMVVALKIKSQGPFFVTLDKDGFEVEENGDSVDKIHFDFYMDTYNKYTRGQEQFDDEYVELEEKLNQKFKINDAELKELDESCRQHEELLQKLKSDSKNLNVHKNKRNECLTDYQNLKEYHINIKECIQKKKDKLSSLRKEKENAIEDVKEIEASNQELRSCISDTTSTDLKIKLTSMIEMSNSLSKDIKCLEEQLCKLEIDTSKSKAKEDYAIRNYNLLLDEIDGLEDLKLQSLDDLTEEHRLKLTSLTSTKMKEFRLAQESLETHEGTLENIKCSVQSNQEQVEKKMKKLELDQMELKNLQKSIKDEEADMDRKIMRIREKLLHFNENNGPKLEELKSKLEDLKQIAETKRAKIREREENSKIFIEKAIEESTAYMNKAIEVRDLAYQSAHDKLEKDYVLTQKYAKWLRKRIEKYDSSK